MPTDVEFLQQQVAASAEPMPLAKLKASLARYGWNDARVRAALQQACAERRVQIWPGRSRRYWHRDVLDFVAPRLAAAARETAVTKQDLARRARPDTHCPAAFLEKTAIPYAVRAGQLRKVRLLGRTLYAADGAALALARGGLELLKAALRARRVSEADIESALGRPAPPAADEQAMLEAIRRLQNSPGESVSVHRLRAQMPSLAKADFDLFVMDLARRQKLYLVQHDHGWALPEEERSKLVHDGGTKLYVAVKLRE